MKRIGAFSSAVFLFIFMAAAQACAQDNIEGKEGFFSKLLEWKDKAVKGVSEAAAKIIPKKKTVGKEDVGGSADSGGAEGGSDSGSPLRPPAAPSLPARAPVNPRMPPTQEALPRLQQTPLPPQAQAPAAITRPPRAPARPPRTGG
jgi:hypothetical protein